MATNLKVKIEFVGNPNSSIDYDNSQFPALNNISNVRALSKRGDNIKPFLLGVSELGDGSVFEDSYDGIISYEGSNASGFCYSKIVLTGKNISFLGIQFEPALNEYATQLTINGKVYTNNSTFMFVDLKQDNLGELDKLNNVEIVINKWSKPNKPIVIDGIYCAIVESFNSNVINELTIGQQIGSNDGKPSFSVIGQYGNFQIVDKNNSLKTYMNSGLLKFNNRIIAYYNNMQLGVMLSEKWTYNAKSNTFDVNLIDETSKFEEIKTEEIYYKTYATADELLRFLWQKYTNYETLQYGDTETRPYLSSIVIKHYYHEESNLLTLFNEFCNLTMTSLYINSDGNLEVIRNA